MVDGLPSGISPDAYSTQESQPELKELAKAQESLDRPSVEPMAEIQARAELTPVASESLEKEIKAAVDAVPAVAELKPAEISLTQVEGVDEGRITIEAADADESVMIDTVPLRESPVENNDPDPVVGDLSSLGGSAPEAIIDSNAVSSTEQQDKIADDIEKAQQQYADASEQAVQQAVNTIINATSGIDSNDGTSAVGIIDSNDGEVNAAETTADGGPKTDDRVEVAADETVMIDTVPLPETPLTTAETSSRESIGTWPTPERGGQDVKAEGESPPPPTYGGDPVSPSHEPVQGVSGGGTEPSQIDYEKETAALKHGEVPVQPPMEADTAPSIADLGLPDDIQDKLDDLSNDMSAGSDDIRDQDDRNTNQSSDDQETSPGSDGGTSAEGDSATAAEVIDGQEGTKPGEYGFHYEFEGGIPEMGKFSRQELSETYVSVGDTEEADNTDQAAGVGAGAIATAETDVSEAKTTGTVSSKVSGIPVENAADTGPETGVIAEGLEAGTVAEMEQVLPEMGEDAEADSSSEGSDLPQQPDIDDYMVPKTDADGNPVVDADGNPILVPDMDAYRAAMEEYTAALTAAIEGEPAQETSEAAPEIQAEIDELQNKMSELETLMHSQTNRLTQLYDLRSHINITTWGGVDELISPTIPIITYEKQNDGSYKLVQHPPQTDQDKESLPANIALITRNRDSLYSDYTEIAKEIQNLIMEQAIHNMENSTSTGE